jgi:murein DD-endopeptidase MepM/ murein hydrolase activator NlpD
MKIAVRDTFVALLALCMGALFITPFFVRAETPEELQQQISNHNAQIEELNKEIAEYERQLQTVSSKKQTLQNTLDELDLQRKKLNASISVTKNRISTTQIQISQLADGIAIKEGSIATHEAGLGESLRRLHEEEGKVFILTLLSSDDISNVWNNIDASRNLQGAVNDRIAVLAEEKQSLADTKSASEKKRAELLSQQKTLLAQQGSLDATRKAQNELLVQTKAQESTFQSIIQEKQAAKASFEEALLDLQAELRGVLDPSTIPPAGKGILRWPLDNVYVTQRFGNTAFALSGAYSGKGHNGIDFRASIGTPIKAALTGTVLGTGNTDTVRGCYSYGRWVVIKHANGLATLYAHLSQIAPGISQGASVATGEVIGYSGNTGYATGPHLHFGVFASSATRIMTLGSATNKKTPCANATMPVVAPISGYLDPMVYL